MTLAPADIETPSLVCDKFPSPSSVAEPEQTVGSVLQMPVDEGATSVETEAPGALIETQCSPKQFVCESDYDPVTKQRAIDTFKQLGTYVAAADVMGMPRPHAFYIVRWVKEEKLQLAQQTTADANISQQ
jgi:hypothetical protein